MSSAALKAAATNPEVRCVVLRGAGKAFSEYEVQLPFGILGSEIRERNFKRETALITLHGIGAMVYLLALGELFPAHSRKGWSTNRNRGSGSSLAALNCALVNSAAFLYYGTPADRVTSQQTCTNVQGLQYR